jgi:hypothetical protein
VCEVVSVIHYQHGVGAWLCHCTACLYDCVVLLRHGHERWRGVKRPEGELVGGTSGKREKICFSCCLLYLSNVWSSSPCFVDPLPGLSTSSSLHPSEDDADHRFEGEVMMILEDKDRNNTRSFVTSNMQRASTEKFSHQKEL